MTQNTTQTPDGVSHWHCTTFFINFTWMCSVTADGRLFFFHQSYQPTNANMTLTAFSKHRLCHLLSFQFNWNLLPTWHKMLLHYGNAATADTVCW